MPDELLTEVEAVYRETKAFYTEKLEGQDIGLGFKILYGPPIHRPRFLFLGYQPGGGRAACDEEIAAGAHDHWPEVLEYSVKNWPLAKALQKMFGANFLRECTGMNALFFRAPDVATYRRTVSQELRNEIEGFCLSRAERMVRALYPKEIVAIGFGTLALFGESSEDLTNSSRRVLTKTGLIAGRRVTAVLHLSGSRISNADRRLIADQVLKRVAHPSAARVGL